jgi:hypothetical protein
MIKRYELDYVVNIDTGEETSLEESELGSLVKYEDYEKLLKENEELKKFIFDLGVKYGELIKKNYGDLIKENEELKKEIEELKEYKSMYENLCK